MTLRNQIENLNRKTLGYSRCSEIHNKIIGTFIEMEHHI
ncbi:IS1 family transposase [Morganella morganii]|nr:IS1 family transposase [Morganella morganii]